MATYNLLVASVTSVVRTMYDSIEDPIEYDNLKLVEFTGKEFEILVCGYMRYFCNGLDDKIYIIYGCEDIISLCILFFNETFHCNFDSDELHHDFMKCSVGTKITPFLINESNKLHSEFEFILYPNGMDDYQIGFVQFHIKYIASFNKNIESITTYFHIFCKQTKSQYRSICIFDKNNTIKGWNEFNMNLFDCKMYSELDFGCFIEKRDILYKHNKLDCNYTQHHMHIVDHIEYQWPVDDDLLDEFKDCHSGQHFYSLDFSNTAHQFVFCIYCAPKGWRGYDEDDLILGIKLLKLPHGIKQINVKLKFEIFGHLIDNLIWKENKKLSYKDNELETPPDTFDASIIYSLKSKLSFNVAIDINTKEQNT